MIQEESRFILYENKTNDRLYRELFSYIPRGLSLSNIKARESSVGLEYQIKSDYNGQTPWSWLDIYCLDIIIK